MKPVRNKENSQAVATLLGAVENVPNAAMSISSLLVIKLTDGKGKPSVFTRTLSEIELEYLENNQDILKSPETLLENLAKIELGTSGTAIQITP